MTYIYFVYIYFQAQKVANEVQTAVTTVLTKVEKLRSTKREKTEVKTQTDLFVS